MGNITSLKKKYKILNKRNKDKFNDKEYIFNNIQPYTTNIQDTQYIKNVSYDLIQFSDYGSDDSSEYEIGKNIDDESSHLLYDHNYNIFDDRFSIDNLQKIYIFNLQFISLWLNVYNNNVDKYNIPNMLIYDFNTHFLQNKQIPYPSNNRNTYNSIFNVVSNQNINNFLCTLIMYYKDKYRFSTKINNNSDICDVITFIQELIMIFIDKKELSLCMIGNVNLCNIKVMTYYNNQVYKKHNIYDVYNDGIFSSKNNLIKNTKIKTIFDTSMILTNLFEINIGYVPVPIQDNHMISILLSLFYRFMMIYGIGQ